VSPYRRGVRVDDIGVGAGVGVVGVRHVRGGHVVRAEGVSAAGEGARAARSEGGGGAGSVGSVSTV
jgi:hypothetical protein